MYLIKKFLLYMLLLSSFEISANYSTLLIKIPTRSRPDQFFKNLDTYYENLSHTLSFTFLITCDRDDTSMNNKDVIKKLKRYPNLVFSFGNCTSKVEAYNKDVNNFDFDMLIVASDDIVPVVKNFDAILFQNMKEAFPDFDGVLNINDGKVGRQCNTIPILGGKYYKRFGYIYHPAYKALVCDVELTNVSKILKKEKVVDQVLMKHNHHTWHLAPKDNLYKKNETYHNQDKIIFAQRGVNFFDLPQKEIERATPKLWSILICTIEERKASFTALYEKLTKQIQDLDLQDHIEVLYFKDKRGEHTVGHKRNVLLEQSKGKYVSFIDDDDDIHDKYIELIATKLGDHPDCVNLNGIIRSNDQRPKKFIHSIEYKSYFEKNNTYFRPPNHLNPIRRSIAVQFTFPEKNRGEDTDWAMQIVRSGLLRTEETIDEPYYFYYYVSKPGDSKRNQ